MLKVILGWIGAVGWTIGIMLVMLSTRASRVGDDSGLDIMSDEPEIPAEEIDDAIEGAYADYDRYRTDRVMPGESDSRGDR